MKFLILIAVVLVVVWLLRGLRKPLAPPPPPAPPRDDAAPGVAHEEMVSCDQCGVHLPRSEALPGRGGVFCSEAHRSAYETRRGR